MKLLSALSFVALSGISTGAQAGTAFCRNDPFYFMQDQPGTVHLTTVVDAVQRPKIPATTPSGERRAKRNCAFDLQGYGAVSSEIVKQASLGKASVKASRWIVYRGHHIGKDQFAVRVSVIDRYGTTHTSIVTVNVDVVPEPF